MFRIPLIALAANALLWTLQVQINHYIAPWDMSLFLGGLTVAFASLRLSGRDGARALLLTGLWFDAGAPVPFGLHALFFLLCHAVILALRNRIARNETMVGVLIAALANLGVMLALTAALLHRNPAPLLLWPRFITDSLLSFLVILLIAPWFFALQERAYELAGVSLRREQRGVV